MRNIRKLMVVLMVGVLSVVVATSVHATLLTFDYNFEFSGATPPAGTAPWLKATFDDAVGPGNVRLTMDAMGLIGNEFVTEWNFNLNPLLDPTLLTFTPVSNSDSVPNSINTGVDAFQADGDGKFDIQFDFPPPPGSSSGKFTALETVVYDIGYTGLGTIDANSFNFLSAPGGGAGSFHVAAHVQGIGPSGALSGWVGDRETPVPEPGTLLLLGSGLVGLGAVALRQRRK